MNIRTLSLLPVLLTSLMTAHVNADRIDDALSVESRPSNDQARDPSRKPAEVLRFLAIKDGMQVLDIFAGGGYYSEILSHVVGPKGGVTLYNNQPWEDFVGKAVKARLKDNRLSNVEHWIETPENVGNKKQQYDAAIFVLGMHDLYYADPKFGWTLIDRSAFLKGIFALLKPGAVLGIIDHKAQANSDAEKAGKTYHRVAPKTVIKDLQAAGFILDGESNILQNDNDDLLNNSTAAESRGKTSRFILRFKKPQ